MFICIEKSPRRYAMVNMPVTASKMENKNAFPSVPVYLSRERAWLVPSAHSRGQHIISNSEARRITGEGGRMDGFK